MRSAVIIVGGLVLLALFAYAGSELGDSPRSMRNAAKIFLALWLVVALVNMWIGVSRAGYSVAEELPIFLAIFLIPAAAAAVLWWKYS